ncbi:uncharacterized protein FIBRA_06108 [Fibroporia radiculosa]|uniref:Uncharacterized protein n=1 Tax=Fibroporia radiculosa TaxID=599839 RepID=J4GS72_9APHY|nr:uncharacterized protein FIBRA_06108 [Fibroporia radiculosa]CCM03955.1 predicted protein [Fibroporia radiculosa]
MENERGRGPSVEWERERRERRGDEIGWRGLVDEPAARALEELGPGYVGATNRTLTLDEREGGQGEHALGEERVVISDGGRLEAAPGACVGKK